MLKKSILNKILITTIFAMVVISVYTIPINKNEKENEYEIEYVTNTSSADIFLINDQGYLVKNKIILVGNNIIENTKSIIDNLINKKNSRYPTNLKGLLNTDIIVNSIKYKDNTVYIDFNNKLFSVNKELEEKIVESLIYSITSLDKVENISISINGKRVEMLPLSKIALPETLNKSFGINKIYNIRELNDIEKVVTYYIQEINDKSYYVPVTEYTNSSKDKIKIIIDNLSSSYIYETNLITYLNSNTSLIDYEINDNHIVLNFTEDIFNGNDFVLEEVLYSISASVFDNYDIKTLIFMVNNKKIATKTQESIENN